MRLIKVAGMNIDTTVGKMEGNYQALRRRRGPHRR